jgi:hypothetical protein
MKRYLHIPPALVILLFIGFAILRTLQTVSTASGYPAPPTPERVSGHQLVPRIWLPLILNNFPPISSTSYYVGDPVGLQALGVMLGRYDRDTPGKQDHLIIFAFGTPGISGGQYGVWMVRNKGFVSVAQAALATRNFADAYIANLGNDTVSQLRVVIGVNNFGAGVTTGHAGAFGGAVDYARVGFGPLDSQVKIVAGFDAELNWNMPAITKAWVDTYMDFTSHCTPGAGVEACLYNFGNAICPETGFGNCNNNWTRDDVWYISSGAKRSSDSHQFVAALPEIYNTEGANARQWQNMSLYSAICTSSCQPFIMGRRGPIYFTSALTTYGACGQVATLGESCAGFDNPPSVGYLQLYNEVNKDSRTAQAPIRWSTDIKYQVFP